MTEASQTVIDRFQVRKSSREKREFRAWLRKELEGLGWSVSEDHAALYGTSVIAGDPDKAKVLCTAHYDTQAVLPFPNFITPRNLGVYLLFNLLIVLVFFLIGGVTRAVAHALPLPWYIRPWIPLGVCVFAVWWMFFGKANRHTMNDNTSGVLTLLEIAHALPPEDREKVCLVFFDNEERGMLGSSHFASQHKEVKKYTLVLNFDCVGDGDALQFFPTAALRQTSATLDKLDAAFRPTDGKSVEVVRKGGFYPSDNASFRLACGVCALKWNKLWGFYMDRIHTAKDTVLDPENLRLLTQGVLNLAQNI